MLRTAKEENAIPLPLFRGGEVLPLAADLLFSENRIPEKPNVAENSRPGFRLHDSTLRWGWSGVNSNTALEMRGTLYETRVRSRCTGKERDAESGCDYFGARYYCSTMGRWMSPDWSSKPAPVPYAIFEDPQTLNLYSYVRNNPLNRFDVDGHCDSSD